MRKIISLFCLIVILQTAFAQSKITDSLKVLLANTQKSDERFNLFTKIGENDLLTINVPLDSASCIEMLHIAQQLKSDSLKAISYNCISTYYYYRSEYGKALEFFIKGVPLAEKVNDRRRLSSLYIDISNIYMSINNPDEWAKYLLKADGALPEKESPMYNYMAIQVTRQWAMLYLKQQKADSAFKYAQKTKEINISLKSPFNEGLALALTARAYEQLGDNSLAEVFFKKSIATSDSTKNYRALARVKTSYSIFLLKQKRTSEAKTQSLQSFLLGVQLDNNLLKQEAADNLQIIYENLGQTDSAYYYSKIAKAMREALFNQENLNKINVMGFNEQIRITEEEAQKLEIALQRKQNIQYSLLALGIVLLVITYLLLSRRLITNSKVIQFLGVVALLVVFEFLNLLLHPFLEGVTNHSPVLMLLTLVCIAALLVPLHHKLEKWATTKLVEKNKQIRLTAAKRTIQQLDTNADDKLD
jgi:tetratricopeptide (TPR) repeat protein